MALSAGSAATMVWTRMTGISSSVSGAMIDLASGAVMDVTNFAGTSISCADVPEKYFNAVVNLTAAYARANLDGGAVTFSTDGLSISKGSSEQLKFFVEQANKSLLFVRGIKYKVVYA
jgi:hypothetical protein